MQEFLLTTFVLFLGGIIAVPIASRFGLGSVLGYLIAGMLLGPVLQSLGVDIVSLQHFAEFGVVMMLFLVGLELEPKVLWDMRAKLLGLGGMQVGITTLLVMAGAMILGLSWSVALACGLILALSSTAIVLQTLGEKGLMKSDGGQSSFSVLLFQDIAVIPMLALLPLLALPELADVGAGVAGHGNEAAAHSTEQHDAPEQHDTNGHADDAHGGDAHGHSGPAFIDTLPGWQRALLTIGAIAAVIVGGSYLTRPLFRFIAWARLRELFVAAALVMVMGIALLMGFVGLSAALGTFLAGVVLANSEYRHELESDIDPFRGMFLGVFFITVGALIDFGLLFSSFFTIIGLTLGVMLLKALVLLALARAFRLQGGDKWLFGMGLAQAGEFGFVLISFTVANNVLPTDLQAILTLVVALSMVLTPVLFILYDRVIAPKYAADQAEIEADEIDMESPIIIAGHGRFGGIINRMLRMNGHETVVLDHSSSQLDMLRTFGFKAFFGDATRPDMLEAAGIKEAKLLVIAIDDREQTTALTHYVTQNHPHVHVVARAHDRNHVYELYAAGSRDIIRETFDSAVRAGRSALEALGLHPYEAELKAQDFVARDKRALAQLAEVYDADIPTSQNAPYVERAKELMKEQEEELLGIRTSHITRSDRGWVPPGNRDVEAESQAADVAKRGD